MCLRLLAKIKGEKCLARQQASKQMFVPWSRSVQALHCALELSQSFSKPAARLVDRPKTVQHLRQRGDALVFNCPAPGCARILRIVAELAARIDLCWAKQALPLLLQKCCIEISVFRVCIGVRGRISGKFFGGILAQEFEYLEAPIRPAAQERFIEQCKQLFCGCA